MNEDKNLPPLFQLQQDKPIEPPVGKPANLSVPDAFRLPPVSSPESAAPASVPVIQPESPSPISSAIKQLEARALTPTEPEVQPPVAARKDETAAPPLLPPENRPFAPLVTPASTDKKRVDEGPVSPTNLPVNEPAFAPLVALPTTESKIDDETSASSTKPPLQAESRRPFEPLVRQTDTAANTSKSGGETKESEAITAVQQGKGEGKPPEPKVKSEQVPLLQSGAEARIFRHDNMMISDTVSAAGAVIEPIRGSQKVTNSFDAAADVISGKQAQHIVIDNLDMYVVVAGCGPDYIGQDALGIGFAENGNGRFIIIADGDGTTDSVYAEFAARTICQESIGIAERELRDGKGVQDVFDAIQQRMQDDDFRVNQWDTLVNMRGDEQIMSKVISPGVRALAKQVNQRMNSTTETESKMLNSAAVFTVTIIDTKTGAAHVLSHGNPSVIIDDQNFTGTHSDGIKFTRKDKITKPKFTDFARHEAQVVNHAAIIRSDFVDKAHPKDQLEVLTAALNGQADVREPFEQFVDAIDDKKRSLGDDVSLVVIRYKQKT